MKHKHAELMMQYAQDAMETDKPWERWQYQTESMQEGDVEHVCFAIHSHNNMEVMFGMVHLTKEAAEQHSYALFKINNQVAN